MPIQTGVLLATDPDTPAEARLTGQDYELMVETRFPLVELGEPGSAVIPAKALNDLVKALPEGDVILETTGEGNKTLLRSGRSEYEFLGYPPEEFMPLPALRDASSLQIEGAALKRLIRGTLFAASVDGSRPQLTGLNLQTTEDSDRLKAAATDGSRLARRTEPLAAPAPANLSAIVPARAMNEVLRLAGEEETVTITLGPTHADFTMADVRVMSRLIEGQFPSFERVIPKEYTRCFTTAAQDLAGIARRCQIIAADSQRIILELGEEVTLKASSSRYGRAQERLAAVVEGEGLEMACNVGYLLGYLNTLASEAKVRVEMTAALSPLVLKVEGEDNHLYVLMPMHLM